MKRNRLFILLIFVFHSGVAQKLSEKYRRNQTVTYDEAIQFYSELDKKYSNASLLRYGLTDVGKPLHLFVIASDEDINPVSVRQKNKAIVLINNGIHPGEPDGIDASMKLAEDLLTKPEMKKMLDSMLVCIIPVYNIDGALMRGCCSRVNQDGPEEYGFRANAQNLDLNRDFIKCDALNSQSFHSLFRPWDPDVFIDTHVSDGADYTYTMTLIATQHNKLEKNCGNYQKEKMVPAIYKGMEKLKVPMCPYVNTYGEIPDSGIVEFMETPRFATGYAALYHTFGFTTESHMLKPFPERVEATFAIEKCILEYTSLHAQEIRDVRYEAKRNASTQETFPLRWELDTTRYEMISFKGYEAKYKNSEVSGLPRLFYDRSAPYEKKVKFYNQYYASASVKKPAHYLIPQAWGRVIDRMKAERIWMHRLSKDTTITGEVYFIEDYQSTKEPYEGHHIRYDVKVRAENRPVKFYKGDYVIDVDQPENRFIVETLEPLGTDSYFTWGFFDAILQGKEYFSSYVFEEKAIEILKEDAEVKRLFEEKKSTDSAFAKNAGDQLDFIYRHSRYFEKTYHRYPVVRIPQKTSFSIE